MRGPSCLVHVPVQLHFHLTVYRRNGTILRMIDLPGDLFQKCTQLTTGGDMRNGDNRPKRFGYDNLLNQEIAGKLRSLRQSSGLTQVEMALKMGTSQKTVWAIENAVDNLSLTKMVRYMKALELEIPMKFDPNTGKLYILWSNRMKIEIKKEDDGRWIAEIPELPGVMAYGDSRIEAISKAEALALRVLADKLEHGEEIPELNGVFAVSA